MMNHGVYAILSVTPERSEKWDRNLKKTDPDQVQSATCVPSPATMRVTIPLETVFCSGGFEPEKTKLGVPFITLITVGRLGIWETGVNSSVPGPPFIAVQQFAYWRRP